MWKIMWRAILSKLFIKRFLEQEDILKHSPYYGYTRNVPTYETIKDINRKIDCIAKHLGYELRYVNLEVSEHYVMTPFEKPINKKGKSDNDK